jgi:hypothetical protein
MGIRKEDAFPGKYLRTAELKERPRNAVISHVVLEIVGQGADAKEKPVAYFEGDDTKPMVINVTNWDTLSELFGPDSDDWEGGEVYLSCERTRFAGKAIDGTRVGKARKNGDGFPA